MVRRTVLAAAIAAILLWHPGVADAAPIMTVRPATLISADPGDTVGWGYDLINDSDGDLFITGVSAASPASGATIDLGVFDFFNFQFFVGAHQELHVDYDKSLGVGLVEMTLSPLLAAGTTVTGQVFLDYLLDLPTGPSDGTFTMDVSAITNTAPVPEPSTLLLLGSGAVGLVARRRRAGRDTRS